MILKKTESCTLSIRYCVAGHPFTIHLDEHDELVGNLSQYKPFAESPTDEPDRFELSVATEDEWVDTTGFTEEVRQDDGETLIVAGRIGEHLRLFRFFLYGKPACQILSDPDFRKARILIESERLYSLNNALMLMYALSTAEHDTALFHSSVVSHHGRGYMFLGKSGTGKSTHTSLWLKHIEDTELMNDDNPVVRIIDGTPMVFGSPWSGKTPCYRNVCAPIGAIVQLSQAPVNEIRPIGPIEAYAALLPSISGARWNKRVADGLHRMQTLLISHTAMYHLRCLPDRDAALTCWRAIAGEELMTDGTKIIEADQAISEVARLLAEGRRVVLPVRGYSMLPFIIGDRDSVELVKASDYAVGDVALAYVNGTHYVLHRITNINDNGSIELTGDGNLGFKEHCQKADLIGKAEFVITPSGRRKSLTTAAHLRRARLWQQLLPVRRWILAIYKRTILKLIK